MYERGAKKGMFVACCCMTLGLVACAGQQASIVGYDPSESGRDEFAILTNPPLTLPPDFTLRPPRQSSIVAQDEASREQIETILLGRSAEGNRRANRGALLRANLPEDDVAFLEDAGATQADPEVRAKLEEDATRIVSGTEEFLDRLRFWESDDAAEEEKELLLPGEVPRIITTQ